VIGRYNLVWGAAGSAAYFIGGTLLETLGLRSLFWVPVLIHGGQLWLTVKLERQAALTPPSPILRVQGAPAPAPPLNPRPIAKARVFLRMAWVANPFAYVAINTVAALIPGIARALELSAMEAGFACSIWFFARLAVFFLLSVWRGWQYQFQWLVGAYLCLIVSFGCVLLLPTLSVLLVAQLGFGAAIGLLYHSSLFYSMDAGDTKGDHGGMHESAIGAGVFVGPLVGGAALWLFPGQPKIDAWAVGTLLVFGLLGILWIRRRG
jgi:predicted MFS family arabinose efflux permease